MWCGSSGEADEESQTNRPWWVEDSNRVCRGGAGRYAASHERWSGCERGWVDRMLMLAQSGFAALDAVAPTPLADSPALSRYLFESPWLAVIAAAGLGMIVFAVYSTRHQLARARLAAAIGVVVAVCVFVLAAYVQTSVEQMKARAVQLVRLTAAADLAGVKGMLTPDAVLLVSSSSEPEPLDRILVRVQNQFSKGGMYEIKDHRVIDVQAAEVGTRRGRVQIKVSTTPQVVAFAVPSWWRLDFEQHEDGSWKVAGIELLSIGGGVNLR